MAGGELMACFPNALGPTFPLARPCPAPRGQRSGCWHLQRDILEGSHVHRRCLEAGAPPAWLRGLVGRGAGPKSQRAW
eukprot:6630927-Pyramimonas_sp.AAC.1